MPNDSADYRQSDLGIKCFSKKSKLFAAQELAESLISQYQLTGWRLELMDKKKALGQCFYRKKLIKLSLAHIACNTPAEIENTIRHEIAHAIAGIVHADYGHGQLWKRMAFYVGARPERCSQANVNAVAAYQAICGGCKTLFGRHRSPSSTHFNCCTKCGPIVGRLIWVKK